MKKHNSFTHCWGILSLLLLVTAFSCSDDKDEELKSFLTPAPNSETIFQEGFQFEDRASTQSISFESSHPWTAEIKSEGASAWCKINPKSGKAGHATIAVSISENTEATDRSAVISLRAGGLEKNINLTQASKQEQPNKAPLGLSYSPENPDADQALTITFRADTKSPLYGYTGDVYVHIGVIDEGDWMFVPAEWNQNVDKCKMTSTGENQWSINLSPSIRNWFNSGENPVNKLGVVFRSSDGSKKGLQEDAFIQVTDNKYKGFTPGTIKELPCPSEAIDGINYKANGTEVTFVLYDSDNKGNHKDYAYIIGDFNNWKLSNTEDSQMYRDNTRKCWWITIDGIDPNKEYAFQYYVGMKNGEALRIADAYAEKILDPNNDKYIAETTYPSTQRVYPEKAKGIVSVFRTAPDHYNWKNEYEMKDMNDLMIYELHIRDFSSSGDLNGVIEKLDYLKSLNINAIELMPIQEFDGNDSWGYNPCFFFAMDKAYGTKVRYKEFIDECHKRNLAVILDVVYNHATGNMPFAKLYWNQSANKTATNNPWFNVDAPHPYSVFHDFNHESPLVRQFVKRNLQFLLKEYHVDGFRFDLSKGLTQRQCNESNAGNYDASRIAILKDYHNAVVEANPKAVMILEHFCADSEEKELAEAGMQVWRNANNAFCQSGMGWQEESSFANLYTGTNHMPFGAYVGYMESHDEERTAFKAKEYGAGDLKQNLSNRMKSMASNAVFLLATPGPKMIWQFGEMGYDVSIEENGRTGKKPLHWEYLNNADRKGLVNVYERMMEIREKVPQLFDESGHLVWNVTESFWKDCRSILLESTDGKKCFAVGNFTPEEQIVSTPVPSGWSSYFDLMTQKESSYEAGSKIKLPPHSFVLLGNEPFN